VVPIFPDSKVESVHSGFYMFHLKDTRQVELKLIPAIAGSSEKRVRCYGKKWEKETTIFDEQGVYHLYLS
jgi:hypothetical protein